MANDVAGPDGIPGDRLMELARRFTDSDPGDDALQAWFDTANVVRAEKYAFLTAAAERAGVEGWTCPALAELWADPAEAQGL